MTATTHTQPLEGPLHCPDPPTPSLAATGLSTELCSVVMSYAASAAASLVVAGHSPVFFSCSPLMSMNSRPCDPSPLKSEANDFIRAPASADLPRLALVRMYFTRSRGTPRRACSLRKRYATSAPPEPRYMCASS